MPLGTLSKAIRSCLLQEVLDPIAFNNLVNLVNSVYKRPGWLQKNSKFKLIRSGYREYFGSLNSMKIGLDMGATSYCRKQHNERVSIKRVRELRIKIQNETRIANNLVARPNCESTFENHQISNCYVIS